MLSSRIKETIREEKETNSAEISVEEFVRYYNENIPEGFPRATTKILLAFQQAYPSLFSKNGKWTIDKHRKKFMDWHPSYEKQLSREDL